MASMYSWAQTIAKRISMDRTGRKKTADKHDSTSELEIPGAANCWDIYDVANFFKVTPDTVREWRRHGYGPPPRRVGRHLRWVPDEVLDWFRELPMDNAA
ncbi:helix-turn-helix transcriptional regulator [Nocardia africana]